MHRAMLMSRQIVTSIGCQFCGHSMKSTKPLPPRTISRFLHSFSAPNMSKTLLYERKVPGSFLAASLDDSLTENTNPETGEAREIRTDNASWGTIALDVAYVILESSDLKNISLYSFNAQNEGRLAIKLDKLTNQYGSPSLEEIEDFSRNLNRELGEKLGEEKAGMIEVEVSSPGAERVVLVPEELDRFKDLPMTVNYMDAEGCLQSKVFDLFELVGEEGAIKTTKWKFADTKAHRGAKKGRGLTKKEKEMVFEIQVGDLKKVNLFLDM